MTVHEVARLFDALDIRLVLVASWRGGELDRLLDEGHAAISGVCAGLLRPFGWEVLSEVTFAEYGERGSIDLLAWHAGSRTLLVIEIKTEITSAEETLRRHDVKVRLAPRLCRDRFGAAPASVGRLLVLADSSANRSRVARLGPLLDGVYPARGRAVRAWLARPAGSLGGVLFLQSAPGGGEKIRPRRVRVRSAPGRGRSTAGPVLP
jgi:hypothetical protein